MSYSELARWGAALARALQESGRTVLSVPVNEYGSDHVNTTVTRGDPTDFEFALRPCVGVEVIYTCLNGPANDLFGAHRQGHISTIALRTRSPSTDQP